LVVFTSPDTPGTYEITFVAEDGAGNQATLVIKVEVVLATAPLIKLVGQSPLVVEAGAVYSDPGATAIDLVDGDLSADVVSSAVDEAVNSAKLGTYGVVYSLAKPNSRGLEAEPVRRTVIVRDTTPPVCFLQMGVRPTTKIIIRLER
jgi:hypothetical protein